MRRPLAAGLLAAGALVVLACTAVLAARGWSWPSSTAAAHQDVPVVRRAGFAMGTFVQVVAAGAGAQAAADAALEEVARLDRLLNRFDATSPVAAINAQAGRGMVEVPAEVGEVVTLALDVARRTGGAFDPTVAPLVDAWGFGAVERGEPPSRPPSPQAIEEARQRVDYTAVRLEREGDAVLVGLARAGMALDLGGIAKGYAADRALAVLRAHGVSSALVDVGGEIAVLGRRPATASDREDGEGWRVGIQHPRDPRGLVTTVELTTGAVATSGDYERLFEWEGRRYHHLIDPRTGWPATGLVSVSVLHESAAVADALATAVMVLGPRRGQALVREWPGAHAILVDESLRVTRVQGP
ncbi:MAG: FAD:protein FMN transferase [Firmicutes bacterium]|nr:FAD:protein FMN transferase [Bacillota bacterium]